MNPAASSSTRQAVPFSFLRRFPCVRYSSSEAVLTLPDAKEKSFTAAPVLAALGQRTPYEVRTAVVTADGNPRPTQVAWNVEVVRQRGMDVLLNVMLDKRDRQSSALVRGQSLEF